ncbi:transposase [Methylocaldum marinum]|uniref:Transposase n=1 Tax=Methylocaldum marinum TaxID=1432792 RepID=A0A250L085_9GAMM|nr:transposase [Methylocaldum marinum]
MPTFYLGIDVAKAKLDCALRLPNGKFRTKVIANSQDGFATLVTWLTGPEARNVHVCMEATGVYWEDVAQCLATQGFTVSVINPAQIKAYAASRLTRTKTDAVDARLIAEFCAERLRLPGRREAKPKSPCARSCCVWMRCKPCGPRKVTAWRSPGTRCAPTFKNT